VITGLYSVGSLWDAFKGDFRPQVILQIQLDKVDNQGKPILVTKTLTGSMDPRATMRLWVESLISRSLSEQEANQLDISKVFLGAQCQVQIAVERKQDGNDSYKIKALLPSTAQVVAASPTAVWDYRSGDYNGAPNWILKKFATSREYTSKYPNGGPVETKLGAPQQAQGQGAFKQYRQPPAQMPQYAPTSGGLANAAGMVDEFGGF
jgi:hypothetical protein